MIRSIVFVAVLLIATPAQAQWGDSGRGGGYYDPRGYVYPSPEGAYPRNPRINCRALRARCLHKEELGEVGQGNCQRYRQFCGGGY